MFVVFEGIDGSGKTSVSNRVARRLRDRGIAVDHVREGGEFASPLVRRLREVGKDPRNLALEPLPELLLYLAREAQILSELTRPALARGGVVFADRYLYSYVALSHHARGLPIETVQPLVDGVAGGLWPDLVVLLDVDPHLARARRRVSKIDARAAGKPTGTGSRKGLAGAGAQRRVRAGYLELARRDPDRWMVVENSAPDVELRAVVDRVCEEILRRAAPGGKPARSSASAGAKARAGAASAQASADRAAAAGPHEAPGVDAKASVHAKAPAPAPAGLTSAAERFFAAVEARAVREPAVAAYLIAGMGNPAAHALRERLAEAAPHVVAYGLRGLGDEEAWRMRERLRDASPQLVARSLDGIAVEGERAEAMRLALADAEPAAVLATLGGNDSPAAWALRQRLAERDLPAVVGSLRRLDSPRAWELRERYLRRAGEAATADPVAAAPLAGSLRGVASPEAWRLRRACFDAAPVAVLESLAELDDDESFDWRERWVERAPRVVLRSLIRVDHPRGWALRQRMAPRAKEALDSMSGMDGEEAWRLREEAVTLWPSTAVKSLGSLIAGERGRALALRALGAEPDDLSLLKHVTSLTHHASAGGSWEESD